MMCKCGSPKLDVVATVIGLDKDSLTARYVITVSCADCQLPLASNSGHAELSPVYNNLDCKFWAERWLSAAREGRASK